jgi:ABC-type transport system substrate-binding protein
MRQVIPNIARDYELRDGDRTLVLHLRRGMRWSDGQPFTAEDIMFWYKDISLNKNIGSATALRFAGAQVTIRKVDDRTVEFVSPVPCSLLPALLAGYTESVAWPPTVPTVAVASRRNTTYSDSTPCTAPKLRPTRPPTTPGSTVGGLLPQPQLLAPQRRTAGARPTRKPPATLSP